MKALPLLSRRRAATLLCLAGALIAICSVSLAGHNASAATHRDAPAVKPTIVLVHGAFADASSWDGVIYRLQRDGYTVVAPANPLRDLYSDAAYIAGILSQIKGPIILVGHSYGGAVISTAAAGNSEVKALVYVDAFIPDVGENLLDLVGQGSELSSALVPDNYPPFGPNDVEVEVNPSMYHAVFAADVPAAQAAVMAATQRPLALAAAEEPAQVAAWKTIPSWDVVGMADKVITPEEQLFMAHRANAKITEIPGASHVSMVSHPSIVAHVIEEAATREG